MTSLIKIAVIIPCYNVEKSIVQTLNSLEEQQYKNFKVIIVNDGSKDGSQRIIEEYKKNTTLDIQLINQKNQGVSAARNKGLKYAQTDYVTFLDADDVYGEGFLKILYQGISFPKADVAYCVYSRNGSMTLIDNYQLMTQEEMMRDFFYRKKNLNFFNFIYKRSLLYKHDIWFNNQYKYGEDNEFVWKYLAHCRLGIYNPSAQYSYRDNQDSAMNSVNWDMTDAILASESARDYYAKLNHPSVTQFNNYLIPRTIWSVGKDFARFKNKVLFNRWMNEFPVKESMDKLKKGKPILLGLSSRLYLFNPNLYYYTVGLMKVIK